MSKTIGWVMTTGSIIGFAIVIYISSTLANDPFGSKYWIVGYPSLCLLALLGSGVTRLKEKKSYGFDVVLIILILLVLVPIILWLFLK